MARGMDAPANILFATIRISLVFFGQILTVYKACGISAPGFLGHFDIPRSRLGCKSPPKKRGVNSPRPFLCRAQWEAGLTDTVNGRRCHPRRATRHVRIADVQLAHCAAALRVSAAAAVIRRESHEVTTKISAAQRTATNPISARAEGGVMENRSLEIKAVQSY